MFKKLILLFALIVGSFSSTQIKKENKNILVLHSYHQTSTWVSNIQKGIEDTLDRKDFNINLYVENMDTKRFNSDSYYKSLRDIYKSKYKNIKFDAIIASDNNAFNFLKKYRNKLFGDIPVSFCGVNFFETSDLKGYHNYTGVAENEDFDANIKIMKKLFPNLKTVYITGDYVVSGRLVKVKIRKLIEQNHYNLKFIFSPNKPFKNMLEDISKLDKNSAILYGLYSKDSNGKYLSPDYTSKKIVQASNLPVFTMFDLFMKNGVLGGNMVSSYSQGKEATKIINKILKGTNPNKIPVKLKGTNKNIFDFGTMSKYDITKEDLPKDSIIINENAYIFTKNELNWIAKHPKISVGWEMDWKPFDFVNKYGDYDGITNDILNIISKKTGLNFQVRTNLPWDKLLDEFKKGNIDLLPAIYYFKQREKIGKYTKTYINVQEEFYVLKDSKYTRADDLKNATFAEVRGYINIKQLKKKFPNIKIVEVTNIDEAIKLLQNKKVDALLGGKIVIESIIKEKNIKGLKGIPQTILKTQELKMMVQNDKKELYSIIEKSLENISEEEIIEIKKKWASDQLIFTKDEKTWIKQHPSLKVAIDPNFLPFSGYIDKEHNNLGLPSGFQGMSVDLLRLALKKIGIKPEFVRTKDWAQSLQAIKDGKVDALTTTAISNKRKKSLFFTETTIYAPRVIATNKKNTTIHSLEDLKGKKIGLIKDSSIAHKVEKYINPEDIRYYTNIPAGLKDLNNNKIDAFVESFYVLAYIINEEALQNVKLAHKFDLNNALHISLSKKTISLEGLNVLNKAIKSITKVQKSDIKKQWLSVTIHEEVDWTIVYQIIGLFIFFLAGTLYWAKKLKKAKEIAVKATKEMEKAKEEIEYAHTKVNTLLDNAKQGFLYFNKDMVIGEEYSKEAKNIFEQDIGNKDILILLYPNDEDEQSFNKSTLEDILDSDDDFQQEMLISLLTQNFIINNKDIQVEYKILDKNTFMLILTDITLTKKLAQEVEDKQQILKMVVEIVTAQEQFTEIKKDFEKLIKDIDKFKTLDNLAQLRREIHTYKGNFAQKEMLYIVKELHNFETLIDESLKQNSIDEKILNISTEDMYGWLELDLKIVKSILGEDYFDKTNNILIDKKRLEELYQKSLTMKDVSKYIKELQYSNIKIFFKPYSKLVEQLSIRLGKSINPLVLKSEDIYIDDKYRPFINSLVHIFRNSVDHGIGTPEERFEVGKDEYGTIKCNIEIDKNQLCINISDDGKGIDEEKIKALSVQKGIYTKEEVEKLSQKEVLEIIFLDSFSTSENITDISGRGVGLASILFELKKIDGEMIISNSFGKGIDFRFIISLDDV